MQIAENYQKFSWDNRNEFLDIIVRLTLKETKKCKSQIFQLHTAYEDPILSKKSN